MAIRLVAGAICVCWLTLAQAWAAAVPHQNSGQGDVAILVAADGSDQAVSDAHRRASISLHLLIEEDQTGLSGALAVRVQEVLAASPDAATKAALFEDVRVILDGARKAKSPADFLAVLDSPQARRHGLLARMPAWDSSRALTGPTQQSRTLDAFMQGLLEGRALADSEVAPLIAAIAGAANQPDPVRAVLDTVPAEHRQLVGQLVNALADGHVDATTAQGLNAQLVDMATAMITQRSAKMSPRPEDRDAPGWTPDFDALARGDVSSRSLFAAAGLAEGMARTLGNDRVASDIARAQAQVRSAMQIYQGLSLLAGGAPGAAMSVLSLLNASSAFGPDTRVDQTAGLLKAIGELTQLVQRRFEQLNGRLDDIDRALAAISKDLREVKELSQETNRRVVEVEQTLGSLVGALPRFEQTSKQLTVDVGLANCRAYFDTPGRTPDDVEFNACLRKFQLLAEQPVTLQTPPTDVARALIQAFPPRRIVGDDPWAHATVLADGLVTYLGYQPARPFANPESSPLVSSVFLVHGLAGYMDWVERYGAGRTQSVDWRGLQRLAVAARAQDDFRAAILPPPSRRNAHLASFVTGVTEAMDEPAPAAARRRIKTALLEAVKVHILQALVAEHRAMGYSRMLTMWPCVGSDSQYGTYTVGNEFAPPNALEFGQVVPDTGQLNSFPSRIRPPKAGLLACYTVVEAQFDGDHNGYHIESHAKVSTRLELAGEAACPTQTAEVVYNGRQGAQKLASPPLQELIDAAIEKALRQCLESSRTLGDSWFGGLAARYLSDADEDQLEALFGAALADRTLTEADLSAAMKPVTARLALLRGYLAIAYPAASSNPHLADLIQGELDLDVAHTAQAYACSWAVEQASRANGEAPECDDILAFPALVLRETKEYARQVETHFSEFVDTVDWDRLDAYRLSPTTWVQHRLQAFLDYGRTRAYWEALPRTTPLTH